MRREFVTRRPLLVQARAAQTVAIVKKTDSHPFDAQAQPVEIIYSVHERRKRCVVAAIIVMEGSSACVERLPAPAMRTAGSMRLSSPHHLCGEGGGR